MIIDKIIENKIKTYAFVGPSGTGKSYRAQMVASERDIKYIIDDGLLIKENEVIAGVSAKKAPTKIETVKKALFNNPEEAREIKNAFLKYRPESLLILGTSDNMIKKIRENLGLPELTETIYITDVATEDEMAEAKRIRQTQGKHVIPVPTFEIKKDFSGFILDPLQIFKSKGKDATPYISEKSIIRPTFSYLGNFKISDTVFRQIIEYLAKKTDSIHRINRARIDKIEGTEGTKIYMEVTMVYGYNVVEELRNFKKKCKRELENQTAMNIETIDIVAKGIYLPEENWASGREVQNFTIVKFFLRPSDWRKGKHNINVIIKGEINMSFIVGIDGPAGSGKGTVTKKVANKLGLINIDTGITYRCVALEVLNQNISLEDKEKIIEVAKNIKIDIDNTPDGDIVYLNGKDVTRDIRSKEVTSVVSPVSSIKEVRFLMVELQRKLAEGKNVIMEGRDICTYVFPNADVKIYLDAAISERAKRRYKENQEKGIDTSYEEVYESIRKRDENDKAKEIGALKLAEDSIVVDTTSLTIDEVVDKITTIIKQRTDEL